MSEPLCPKCGQPRPDGWTAQMKLKWSANQKAALAAAKALGEPVGRPREKDYETIFKLREKGYSQMEIASSLNCSRGSIQHALRTQPVETKEEG